MAASAKGKESKRKAMPTGHRWKRGWLLGGRAGRGAGCVSQEKRVAQMWLK